MLSEISDLWHSTVLGSRMRMRMARTHRKSNLALIARTCQVLIAFGAVFPACAQAAGDAADRERNAGWQQDFERGAATTGAMFRWWWPGAAVDAEVLRSQLKSIADAGYKGVEIADVKVGVDYPTDPDLYQYGSEAWRKAVKAAALEARRLGLQVDVTMGARWPAAVPGLEVDGAASSKELVGVIQPVVGGVFAGPVPPPEPHYYPDRTSVDGEIIENRKRSTPRLVAVGAIRCVPGRCDEASPVFDLESYVELTEKISNGAINWRAPDDGDWMLVAHWYRGTGQRNDAPWGDSPYLITDPESRAVDHFGIEGARAFLRYFETTLDEETLATLASLGGSVFEDSIELNGAQLWTAGMPVEFATRRGYSLVPYLVCVTYDPVEGPFDVPQPSFRFPDRGADTCRRVRRDLALTLSELYIDYHLAPFKLWANERGLNFRAQPYGVAIDIARAGALLDIAEDESFASGTSDDWRLIASGVEAAGKRIVSDELIAGGFGGSYRMSTQQIVREVNAQYALGANQIVFHGYPYEEWPPPVDGVEIDSFMRWPGFHAFMPRIPDAFGARNPTWLLESTLARYYARMQLVLRTGERRRDVAIFNQSLNHIDNAFDGKVLLDRGYSYGYLTPGLLETVPPEVDGNRLYPGGPAFKVVVLDRPETLSLAAARRILDMATRGIRIVVIGQTPERIPGFDHQQGALEAELALLIGELRRQRSVTTIPGARQLVPTLLDLDIRPAATSTSGVFRFVQRIDGNVHFFYVHNGSDAAVSDEVRLCGPGVPYRLNAWNGGIASIAEFSIDDGCVATPMTLGSGEAALMALAPDHWTAQDSRGRANPVVESNAETVFTLSGRLMARVTSNSAARASLMDGTVLQGGFVELPERRRLSTWNLLVDSFLPASLDGSDTATRHELVDAGPVPLKPWSSIPTIANVSGIGTYSTSIELGEGWTGTGAHIHLGEVFGAYGIRINGRSIDPVNQLDTRIDVGTLLRVGMNRIEIVVATNLNNALRIYSPNDYGSQPVQQYGLLGPVFLEPYRDVELMESNDEANSYNR